MMQLRRKTGRKATFLCYELYKYREAVFIRDAGEFFILRKFRDNGGGFTEYGSEAYIGKRLVATLATIIDFDYYRPQIGDSKQ